jgi:hypothetical protein
MALPDDRLTVREQKSEQPLDHRYVPDRIAFKSSGYDRPSEYYLTKFNSAATLVYAASREGTDHIAKYFRAIFNFMSCLIILSGFLGEPQDGRCRLETTA